MTKALGPLLLIAVFFVGLSYAACYNGESKLAFAPLFRYWSGKDHFYTTNWDEIGQVIPGRRGKHGFVAEGIACMLVTRKTSYGGPIPLFRYFKAAGVDHFYTTNSGEIGKTMHGQLGNHGYRSEGIAGYCYPKPTKDTVPLYRYWNPSITNHFYTTNTAEIGTTTPGKKGKHGYISEGIVCHVLPFERFPK